MDEPERDALMRDRTALAARLRDAAADLRYLMTEPPDPDLYRLAADVIEGLEYGRPRWTPCSERDPDLFEHVLTWDGEAMDVDYLVGADHWKHRPTGITHWMPLPPPPREG